MPLFELPKILTLTGAELKEDSALEDLLGTGEHTCSPNGSNGCDVCGGGGCSPVGGTA